MYKLNPLSERTTKALYSSSRNAGARLATYSSARGISFIGDFKDIVETIQGKRTGCYSWAKRLEHLKDKVDAVRRSIEESDSEADRAFLQTMLSDVLSIGLTKNRSISRNHASNKNLQEIYRLADFTSTNQRNPSDARLTQYSGRGMSLREHAMAVAQELERRRDPYSHKFRLSPGDESIAQVISQKDWSSGYTPSSQVNGPKRSNTPVSNPNVLFTFARRAALLTAAAIGLAANISLTPAPSTYLSPNPQTTSVSIPKKTEEPRVLISNKLNLSSLDGFIESIDSNRKDDLETQ